MGAILVRGSLTRLVRANVVLFSVGIKASCSDTMKLLPCSCLDARSLNSTEPTHACLAYARLHAYGTRACARPTDKLGCQHAHVHAHTRSRSRSHNRMRTHVHTVDLLEELIAANKKMQATAEKDQETGAEVAHAVCNMCACMNTLVLLTVLHA